MKIKERKKEEELIEKRRKVEEEKVTPIIVGIFFHFVKSTFDFTK